MNNTQPTALIAEDEPLLALALQNELARCWPELKIAKHVLDGASAVREALALRPDVLFFDIRMPGMDGLEAAAELANEWDAACGQPFPQLVFVTAYDQYAVQAFEAQAVDYLLKPVQPQRLQKTVQKLQQALEPSSSSASNLEATLGQLRSLLGGGFGNGVAPSPAPITPPLAMIAASVGSAIHMVPVDEVLYFEAADKYVRVITTAKEYLIRTPLKELLPQLKAEQFWQVHRGTVVNTGAIAVVQRDDVGRATLTLRGRPEKLAVSRLYVHLFKAM